MNSALVMCLTTATIAACTLPDVHGMKCTAGVTRPCSMKCNPLAPSYQGTPPSRHACETHFARLQSALIHAHGKKRSRAREQA